MLKGKFDEVHSTYLNKRYRDHDNIKYHKVNFNNKLEVSNLLKLTNPTLVINCIGLAEVDYCQKNRKKAKNINFLSLKNLSSSLDDEIKLIHISTDQLFHDNKSSHSEKCKTNPLNIYAKTKLLADTYLINNRKNYLILRTNFFGDSSDYKESYSDKIISSLKKNQKVILNDNIYFNPINIKDLIKLTYKVYQKDAIGIFNISSDKSLSKYEFGLKIAKNFLLNSQLVSISKFQKSKTIRPSNMVLTNDKIKKLLKIKSIKLNFYKYKPSRFLNYGRHFIDKDDKNAVLRALNSGQLTQGSFISDFEEMICKYTKAKYAVAVSSCTAGLHISCIAAGLKKNDNVIVPAITFVSTANAATYSNAKVSLCDIDNDTLNLSLTELKKISNKKKIQALIPVHFAGFPCDIKKIRNMFKNQIIIEDAAHALGAKYKDGSKVGSCKYSDATVFSFHPVKPVTAGEGGVITTNSFKIYKSLLRLRSHGINKLDDKFKNKNFVYTKKKINPWFYEMKELGFHYRITDIQCALAISQMKKLDTFISRRKILAKRYRSKLSKFKNIKFGHFTDFKSSGHHLFILRFDFNNMKLDKVGLMNELKKRKIGSQVHYIPISYHPHYENLSSKDFKIKNSIKYYNECLSIPLFYDLSFKEQDYIIDNIVELSK
jgi:UDP-4-amino-4,6-dideoxy-N-acetyl-beta-L-altrosamine transaminase